MYELSDPNQEVIRMDMVKRKVGKCPACLEYLWADVRLETTVRKPTWHDDRDPAPNAYTNATAMQLTHECIQSDG